ncbi:MAG: malto-oligosyltrehalose trehalohydrolase [Bacillota bacterium]
MEQFGPSILDRETGKILFKIAVFNHAGVALQLKLKDGLKDVPLKRETPHIYSTVVEEHDLELLYKYKLEGETDAFPDPYSHYQPDGVLGFSRVVDHAAYQWGDREWKGINWPEAIIYEMHVGTFTMAGTLRSAVEKLDYLVELGINTVEVMPVAQTPGRWNWGYDGANFFSVNHNYGTPDDFKFFVDSCHRKGLAVILDVVYNHFGPEGNYLSLYGPYFTDKYETPWGKAVNYDDAGCEIVRRMVLDNVCHWVEHYHVDGLRLDAVHAINDRGPRHILQEIAETSRGLSERLGRKVVIIAETDANDVQIINPLEQGGYGADAQWMDDFHHTVHTLLTGENSGYYGDYGDFKGLEKVFRNYLYTGEYSRFWKKKRGTDGSANPGRQFVVAVQTHDQVGNRAAGERLSRLVEFPFLKAAAGLLFVSPYIPMLFMGEEYAEENPFIFFTDYIDPQLKQAVSEGRKKEFADFGWEEIPDPEDDNSFYASKLTPREQWQRRQRQIFSYYRDLIQLRRTHPALKAPDKNSLEIQADPSSRLVRITRRNGEQALRCYVNLNGSEIRPDFAPGRVIFNSEAPRYGGREQEGTQGLKRLLPGQLILLEL